MTVLRLAVVVGTAIALLNSCGPNGFVADPGYRADVWNRSSVDIVIERAPFDAGLCYVLTADELGNVEQGISDSLSTIRIWRAGSQQPEQINPSGANELFVVTDDNTQELDLNIRFDADGRRVYDYPALPEIDGQPLASALPIANCRHQP